MSMAPLRPVFSAKDSTALRRMAARPTTNGVTSRSEPEAHILLGYSARTGEVSRGWPSPPRPSDPTTGPNQPQCHRNGSGSPAAGRSDDPTATANRAAWAVSSSVSLSSASPRLATSMGPLPPLTPPLAPPQAPDPTAG